MGKTQTAPPALINRYDPRRAGRRIAHARDDRGQSVDELASLIGDATGERWTGQMIKNIEAGRKRVTAELIPVFAAIQGKSLAHYLVDDPGDYRRSREAGLAQSNVIPLRKRAAWPIEMGQIPA